MESFKSDLAIWVVLRCLSCHRKLMDSKMRELVFGTHKCWSREVLWLPQEEAEGRKSCARVAAANSQLRISISLSPAVMVYIYSSKLVPKVPKKSCVWTTLLYSMIIQCICSGSARSVCVSKGRWKQKVGVRLKKLFYCKSFIWEGKHEVGSGSFNHLLWVAMEELTLLGSMIMRGAWR